LLAKQIRRRHQLNIDGPYPTGSENTQVRVVARH
jgi:hypothetical protein